MFSSPLGRRELLSIDRGCTSVCVGVCGWDHSSSIPPVATEGDDLRLGKVFIDLCTFFYVCVFVIYCDIAFIDPCHSFVSFTYPSLFSSLFRVPEGGGGGSPDRTVHHAL